MISLVSSGRGMGRLRRVVDVHVHALRSKAHQVNKRRVTCCWGGFFLTLVSNISLL
jgi:hypothetical protein